MECVAQYLPLPGPVLDCFASAAAAEVKKACAETAEAKTTCAEAAEADRFAMQEAAAAAERAMYTARVSGRLSSS